jgi:hypothetical protein
MKFIAFFILLISSLNASNLLTYNIYERSDRVDLMLSFDAPYEGRISQIKGENTTTLSLDDLSYDKIIEKSINSNIIQAITLEPHRDTMRVILKSANNIAVIAAKTADGFGLRIRTVPIASTPSQIEKISQDNEAKKNTAITTASNDLFDGRYLSVIALLISMLIFMFLAKRKVENKSTNMTDKSSWLFKSSGNNTSKAEVKMIYKKEIDTKNSVVLLECANVKYLVMTGNSNLLLERFTDENIKDTSDFEKVFENNRKKLDDYLKLQQDTTFDDYKAKAQGDYNSKQEKY